MSSSISGAKLFSRNKRGDAHGMNQSWIEVRGERICGWMKTNKLFSLFLFSLWTNFSSKTPLPTQPSQSPSHLLLFNALAPRFPSSFIRRDRFAFEKHRKRPALTPVSRSLASYAMCCPLILTQLLFWSQTRKLKAILSLSLSLSLTHTLSLSLTHTLSLSLSLSSSMWLC